MASADGSVIISANLDDKQAQAELNRLSKKIDTLNEKIESQRGKQLPLVEQSKQLGAALDAANAKLAQMQSGDSFFTASAIKKQQQEVSSLEKQFNSVNNQIDRMGVSIGSDTAKLNQMKKHAGELAKQVNNAKGKMQLMRGATSQAEKSMNSFANRIKSLTRRVFVFTLITAALRSIKNYMWSAIQTNDQAMASVARLKGALMTLAQPILQVVIPAFTAMVNVITRVVNAISRLVSMIFGTTVDQSAKAAENLYGEQKALKGVGSAAKKASKSLASFDEINQLSTDTGTGSGGGKASGGIKPDFKGVIDDSLSAILELFTGAALLALGAILAFSGANIPLGIGLMVIGAIAIWDAVSTNWGAISTLLQGILGDIVAIVSTALLAIGILLVFSGTNIPLGIGLIIAGAVGLAAVVAANWDTITSTIKSHIGIIMGLVSAALLVLGAIITFSGANPALGIGLLIAGAIGLAATVALNWNSIEKALEGPIGKVVAIVSAALLVLGAIFAFTGANIPLGIGLMLAGAIGLATDAVVNWDSIGTAMQGPIGAVTALVSGALIVLGAILTFSGANVPLGIGLLIAGGVGLATSIAPNWDYILDKLKECWANIKVWWGKNVAPIFTAEWWRNLGIKAVNGLISGFESGLNKLIKGLNDFIDSFNRKFAVIRSLIGVPPEISHIPTVSLPRLAQGAVIPPNREFMAVLGDQKQGTNIETPLATMVQAFKQALSESGYGGQSEATLIVDGEVFGRVVYRANKAESDRIGTTLVEA